MHLVVNFLSAGSGGAINYARNVTPFLAEIVCGLPAGKLTILAYPGLMQTNVHLSDNRIQVIEFPHRSGMRRAIWEYFRLGDELRKIQPDVVFIPYQIGSVCKTIPSVLMIRNMEPFHFQNYPSPLRKRIRNMVLRQLTQRSCYQATHVIAVSQYVAEFACSKLNVESRKISTIYHGRSEIFTHEQSPRESVLLQSADLESAEFLLTCGSLLPYRRCEDVIQAFVEHVAIEFPNLHLVVAGAVLDLNYFEARLNVPIELAPRVHFLGHVSPELLSALYRRCRLFVTATEVEACPNIAIEALGSGCTIVSADSPPLIEIFQDAAVFYPRRNAVELGKRVLYLLNHAARRNEFAARAVVVAGRYSWEHCARQTMDVISSVVENGLP